MPKYARCVNEHCKDLYRRIYSETLGCVDWDKSFPVVCFLDSPTPEDYDMAIYTGPIVGSLLVDSDYFQIYEPTEMTQSDDGVVKYVNRNEFYFEGPWKITNTSPVTVTVDFDELPKCFEDHEFLENIGYNGLKTIAKRCIDML